MFLLFQDGGFGNWEKYVGETPTILLILIILYFIYRMSPIWKEIKISESNARTEEAKSSAILGNAVTSLADAQVLLATTMKEIRFREADTNDKLAESVGKLAESQKAFSDVIQIVSVEQRKQTDDLLILQRVGITETQKLVDAVEEIQNRVETIEKKSKE